MFEIDAVPYFPLRLQKRDQGWLIQNPIDGHKQEVNEAGYWVLRLCDGYRTWGEIVAELGRAFHVSSPDVMNLSRPLLCSLTEAGVVWWRQQRMSWYTVPPPATVLWDLTTRCNLFCRHCVVYGGEEKTKPVSLEVCLRVLEELAAFGVQEVVLSGGEPLMRRNFFDIAEYAVQQGLKVQLATNGTLISAQMAERLAKLCIHIQVSLDGATPEVNDSFRGAEGAWQRSIAGINNLVNAGVPVTMASMVTQANIHQIPDLYALAAKLNVHAFRIIPFVPAGRGSVVRQLEVKPSQMREITAYLWDRRFEDGLNINPMEFECTLGPPPQGHADPATHVGCDGAMAYCAITVDGDVLPCHFFSGVEAENIKDASFPWIWQNSRFLNYFRSLTIADISGSCQECAWLPTCRGSCRAANFANGDLFQSNCHCWLVDGEPEMAAVPAGKAQSSTDD